MFWPLLSFHFYETSVCTNYNVFLSFTNLENELMVARREGWGDRIVREFGMNVYALLYLKWVANKDLLCSTWNSAQCYKAAWMRGVWGRMDTCICMAESLCYSPETVTTFNQLYPIQNNERIHDYCWIPLFCLPHLSW